MLVLTEAQIIAARARSSRGTRLEPRLLADGRYVVNEAVLTAPSHAAIASVLAQGSIETVPTSSIDTDANFAALMNSGRRMLINVVNQPYALQKPASNVYRFEVHTNDYVTHTDETNGTRRAELVNDGPSRGFTDGQTMWASWATVLGTHDGLLHTNDAQLGLLMQVHSDDTNRAARSPVVAVDYSNNLLRILTRSSAELTGSNGVRKVRYSTALPATGTKKYFVIAVTFGSAGHLKVWIDGAVVVDTDMPIGYYASDSPGVLGYPHWGIYTLNQAYTDVVYHANIEYGTTDLSARGSAPLAVPDLTW